VKNSDTEISRCRDAIDSAVSRRRAFDGSGGGAGDGSAARVRCAAGREDASSNSFIWDFGDLPAVARRATALAEGARFGDLFAACFPPLTT